MFHHIYPGISGIIKLNRHRTQLYIFSCLLFVPGLKPYLNIQETHPETFNDQGLIFID
ncbi:MAG TPA: hypothetical protein VK469_14875 [Candidatus Kapabacteria bacterium]|nr:hypothetical protein [Candidatus Kapabacteria bacterium]